MINSIPIPVRLALYSVALFALMGVHLPYWPVWLEAQGISPEGIGMLVALGYFVRTFASPVFSFLADKTGDRRMPLRWLTLASFFGFALFGFTQNFLGIAIVTSITLGAFSPLMPLKESMIMGYVALKGYDYGRIRLWGSVSFIVFSLAGGLILARWGSEGVWASIVLFAGVAAAMAWILPPDPRKGATTKYGSTLKLSSMGAVLRNPVFVLFLIATSTISAGHSVYYVFGTLNWQSLGYTDGFIGTLWGIGVAAEIALFAFSGAVIRHISPTRLILLGAGAGILRWWLTALDPHWGWLIPLQCLHGLTFGATHLGAMHFIVRAVPIQLAATAQGLYAAVAGGLIMGMVMLGVGPLYESFGAFSYLAMVALCALGLGAGLWLHHLWDGTFMNVRLTHDPEPQDN